MAAQVGWRRTQVRVPVGWRCAAQFRCGGAAQVGLAAQVVEQLGVVVWRPGRAQQTLVGAMATDGYCGIETNLANANAKIADNGLGMLSSHSEYKTLTENIKPLAELSLRIYNSR